MGGSKEKSHLDIIIESQHVVLKGTGPDVEPVRLTGQVCLYLSEDTAIRELTLQFRGKAKIPVPSSESLVGSSANISYTVCSHDWSFLEGGDGRHSRTLKAGRHFFPFHLDVGGTLPSSISTSAFGGASVGYKLRAVAVRPGLSHNLTHITPIYLMRSFTHEALEYQQSLEIENTWPDKLMYAVMLPHKAWAGGDTLSVVFKFSPLAKGVHVESIVTTLCETTKVFARSGPQEDTRILATVRHEIVNGQAVEVKGAPPVPRQSRPDDNDDNNDTVTCVNLKIPRSTLYIPTHTSEPTSQSSTPSLPHVHSSGNISLPSASIYSVSLTPPTVTPSHSLEPIAVTHRIRWCIFIRNKDGHVSELRCSLPLSILDTRFLDEARGFSGPSRRMLLEASGLADGHSIPGSRTDITNTSQDADRELPSYNAHVRDRVANMYLPEAATVRVSSPWVGVTDNSNPPTSSLNDSHTSRSTSGYFNRGMDVSASARSQALVGASGSSKFPGPSRPQSGYATPAHVSLDTHVMSHLPHVPSRGASTPLDWVNSELLVSLSLSDEQHQRQGTSTQVGSRTGSARGSRANSRAGSPERTSPREGGDAPGSGPASSASSTHDDQAAKEDKHGHGRFGGLFKATMKPFASLAGHNHHDRDGGAATGVSTPVLTRPPSPQPLHSLSMSALPSTVNHSSDHSHVQALPHHHPHGSGPTSHHHPHHHPHPHHRHPHQYAISMPITPGADESAPAFFQRAFTAVPDYSIASRGFIGGVPPLSSLKGLPSYEEAERQRVKQGESSRSLVEEPEEDYGSGEGSSTGNEPEVDGRSSSSSEGCGDAGGIRLRNSGRGFTL